MTASNGLRRLICSYFDAGVIKIDPNKGFKLKLHDTNPSAPLSPYYISLRTPENKGGPLSPRLVERTGYELWNYAKAARIGFHAAAGLPHAGTPLAQAFARAAREDGEVIPLIQLRKTAGEDSRQIDAIEHDAGLPRGAVVLPLDDLITEGHTKDEGIDVLENKGGWRIIDVLVVMDREQGGGKHLASRGKRLHSLITVPSALEILVEETYITKSAQKIVLAYISNPV